MTNERILTVCDRLREQGIRDASPSPTPGFVQIPVGEVEEKILATDWQAFAKDYLNGDLDKHLPEWLRGGRVDADE